MEFDGDEQNSQHLFLSIVSHELKTPITSIQGFTQAMKRKIDDKLLRYKKNDLFTKDELEKHQEHLAVVMGQIKRLTKLVDDLLDVSVIENGYLAFNWNTVDLKKIIQDLKDHTQVSTSHKLEVSIPDTQSFPVYGDETRLEKLFSNLIGNAVKYSPAHSTISISVEPVRHSYRVKVVDQGVGINNEDKDKIFNLYYRGHNIDRKKISGLGLGLYLCKQIVDMHHGSIYFQPNTDVGTTFFVELPSTTS